MLILFPPWDKKIDNIFIFADKGVRQALSVPGRMNAASLPLTTDKKETNANTSSSL